MKIYVQIVRNWSCVLLPNRRDRWIPAGTGSSRLTKHMSPPPIRREAARPIPAAPAKMMTRVVTRACSKTRRTIPHCRFIMVVAEEKRRFIVSGVLGVQSMQACHARRAITYDAALCINHTFGSLSWSTLVQQGTRTRTISDACTKLALRRSRNNICMPLHTR